jgi:glucose-1-phosphate cytidylyltransferase
MKVVLFCGGLGMRLREYSDSIPKPMVSIGYRPLLWHVMKYYAHYGHKDFILCLGYKADTIKDYFLNYDECISNNFVLSKGGKDIQMLNSDIHDWSITFVDTGVHANVGQRLKAVQEHLRGEETFLANYSDGVTDMPLPEYLEHFQERGKIASFVSVRSPHTYHVISTKGDMVRSIQHINKSSIRINGGFFAFRNEIFDYLHEGEELVEQPFQRLIDQEELIAYRYDGFWAAMDTFKDRQQLEDLYTRGNAPWELWKNGKREGRAVHA